MIRTTSENLSKRELEVLSLIEAGLTNRQIAQRIIVETGTVKRHVHNILGKLNARNRTEAVARVRETRTQDIHPALFIPGTGMSIYHDQFDQLLW